MNNQKPRELNFEIKFPQFIFDIVFWIVLVSLITVNSRLANIEKQLTRIENSIHEPQTSEQTD